MDTKIVKASTMTYHFSKLLDLYVSKNQMTISEIVQQYKPAT